PLRKAFPVMYVGFWINAVSGLLLFAANATGLITNVMFIVKILFVIAAVLLLRVLRNTVFSDAELAEGGVSARGRKLAIVSLCCWTAAVIAGRLTSYPWLVNTYFGFWAPCRCTPTSKAREGLHSMDTLIGLLTIDWIAE